MKEIGGEPGFRGRHISSTERWKTKPGEMVDGP